MLQSADGFFFKLHRNVLAVNSQLFADLFEASHASTDADDTVDGLPVIQMAEKARVMKAVLPLVYNSLSVCLS